VRPIVKPALPRLWRDRQTLQLGSDPGSALVLTGLDAPAVRLLDLLDGSLDRDAILAAADTTGERERIEALLDLLADAGALEDAGTATVQLRALDASERDRLAPDLAALSLAMPEAGGAAAVLGVRQRAIVRVVGAGRVGAPLAAHLAAAGIGTVSVADDAPATMADVAVGGVTRDDTGAARCVAAQRAVRRVTGEAGSGPVPPPGQCPDLVVVAPVGARTGGPTRQLVEAGIAHLPVRVTGSRAVIGPLVLPGATSCLSCADLHRADRDPAWPLMVAQLSAPAPGLQEAVDGTLAAAAAAHAALLALDFLDDLFRPGSGSARPITVNGTLELARPGWKWRRRSWLPHSRCHCRYAEWAPRPGSTFVPEWVAASAPNRHLSAGSASNRHPQRDSGVVRRE
jgi:bacteriocin biosynthesis cyclodehydratase domain-containing protein